MKYILRRIAAVIPVMAVVAVVVFMLIHLSDGDPAAVIAGDNATAEDVEKIRQNLPGQAAAAAVRHLGRQYRHRRSGHLDRHADAGVTADRAAPGADFSIAAFTMLFAVLLAIPLGVLAAWHAGRWLDRLVMVGSVCAFSVPVFLIGYSLVYGFSIKLGWLPVQGYKPPDQGLVQYLRHRCYPVCRWAWSTWRCSRA